MCCWRVALGVDRNGRYNSDGEGGGVGSVVFMADCGVVWATLRGGLVGSTLRGLAGRGQLGA
jgi:hypothetical protein